MKVRKLWWFNKAKIKTVKNKFISKFQISENYRKPANIYLFKVDNRNTRKRCEICSKLTIKIPEWLTLNIFHTCSTVSVVNFEHVIAGWDTSLSRHYCKKIEKIV